MKQKLLLGSFLFTLLILILLYMAGVFTNKVSELEVKQANIDLSELTIYQMQFESLPITRVFTGSIVADQKVMISARLTARISEILVEVGDRVKQGDLLIRLDSGDLSAKVQQSQQAVSSAQAQLNIARKEVQRLLPLYQQKLVSPSQYDQASSELKTAQANFEKAKASVSEAETTFGFSMITAPFDAVIEQRVVDSGDLATPGMQLLSLYNPNTLHLDTNISESLMDRVTVGSELSYQLSNQESLAIARVVRITPASNSSSRSVLVSLDLTHLGNLMPGSFAKVWVTEQHQQKLILPEQALLRVGQLDYVDQLEQGQIKRKLIQLGDGFEVRKGLEAGDKVIIYQN